MSHNTWEEPYIGGSIKTKTKNNWLEHVKQYQKEHNITYRQALSDAKETYIKGGSLESNKVRRMYYAKNFNPLKVHNASQNILSRINKDDAKKHYENKLNITKNELTNIYRDIENIIRRYGITEQIEHTNFATGKKSNTFKYNYMDGIKGITHGKKENMEFYERPRIKNITERDKNALENLLDKLEKTLNKKDNTQDNIFKYKNPFKSVKQQKQFTKKLKTNIALTNMADKNNTKNTNNDLQKFYDTNTFLLYNAMKKLFEKHKINFKIPLMSITHDTILKILEKLKINISSLMEYL